MYGVACAILMALLKVNSSSEEYSLGQEDKIIIVKNITEYKKGCEQMKKKKCRACGFKFRLEKENRYLVRSGSTVDGRLSEKPTIFEMFDCPQCGCQNAVGIYEQQIVEKQ